MMPCARAEDLFTQQPENVNQYLSQSNYVDQLKKQSRSQVVCDARAPTATSTSLNSWSVFACRHVPLQIDTLESISTNLTSQRPTSVDGCVTWARLKFEEYFHNQIAQLLYNFPADQVPYMHV
jgi:ubiquitin-activating enzyme E1